jgi:hypothetical protein
MMDPLSIAASVGSLLGVCIGTAKKLSEVASKFKNAPQTISHLSSQTKLMSFSLSQLQSTLFGDEDDIPTQAVHDPDVKSVLDIALTACTLTLSCIESEVRSLIIKSDAGKDLEVMERAKVVWKDYRFEELLQQLNGQSVTIWFLYQGLQM